MRRCPAARTKSARASEGATRECAVNSRVEFLERPTRVSHRAFEVFAICDDDDDGRLEGPCRDLPNGRRAVLIGVDCATAIDAALQGLIDVIVVDWRDCSAGRLTALSFLHRERPEVGIYLAMDDAGPPLRLQRWTSSAGWTFPNLS